MKDNNSNNQSAQEQEEEFGLEVKQELSKVSTNPKKSILLIVVICAAVAYLAYYFFFSGTESVEPNKPVALPTDISKPSQVDVSNIPSIPTLPDPPKLEEPPELPPPPLVMPSDKDEILPPPSEEKEEQPLPPSGVNLPSTGKLPTQLVSSEEEQKRKEAKWKANIILLAGNPNPKTPEQIQQEADFKEPKNMELLLSRGKIIDAVIETAISSDFGGEVRAVVSRDIYSQSGKVVLIPKGSRAFGEYKTGIDGGYGRVAINWNRIDLATGYSLMLEGTGIDSLGRKGVEGRVDNKYKEKFANSVLLSAFNITLANTLDKITPPVESASVTTENQAAAAQLNNIALGIFNEPGSAAAKIPRICAQIQAAIPDKTSSAFTAFVTTCTTLITGGGGATPDQNLTTVMAAVNTAATSLLTESAKETTPTQAQESSKQAFTDISNTIKDMISQDQFKTTITIDQGTAIKIYVTKDYVFPKKALSKKVIK